MPQNPDHLPFSTDLVWNFPYQGKPTNFSVTAILAGGTVFCLNVVYQQGGVTGDWTLFENAYMNPTHSEQEQLNAMSFQDLCSFINSWCTKATEILQRAFNEANTPPPPSGDQPANWNQLDLTQKTRWVLLNRTGRTGSPPSIRVL